MSKHWIFRRLNMTVHCCHSEWTTEYSFGYEESIVIVVILSNAKNPFSSNWYIQTLDCFVPRNDSALLSFWATRRIHSHQIGMSKHWILRRLGMTEEEFGMTEEELRMTKNRKNITTIFNQQKFKFNNNNQNETLPKMILLI